MSSLARRCERALSSGTLVGSICGSGCGEDESTIDLKKNQDDARRQKTRGWAQAGLSPL
jgi:hypothetical protein